MGLSSPVNHLCLCAPKGFGASSPSPQVVSALLVLHAHLCRWEKEHMLFARKEYDLPLEPKPIQRLS